MPIKSNDPKAERASQLRVSSFFAGIGGFDLAFDRSGFKTVFYCENNDFCRSVLKRHWPAQKNADDIRTLTAEQIPKSDVWTAGFPCQDLSLARTPHGRSGLRGSNSGLFFSFLDLVAEHRPRVVIVENVAGLLNSHKGSDFSVLVSSLTDLGYGVAWRVLNARYFGVPQSRPRVFICGWLNSPANAVRALFEDALAPSPQAERRGFVEKSECVESGVSVPQVSFCISATSGRHTGLDWARSYVTYPNAVRRLTPLECERLQGFPDQWSLPDADYVVPIRGIETARYHAVGNAVCVPVVEWMASRIARLANEPTQGWRGGEHERLAIRLKQLSPYFNTVGSQVAKVSFGEAKWRSGGCAFDGLVIHASVPSRPIAVTESKLIDVIERTKVHARYFLSANAAQGIIRRVDKMRRHLFSPLDEALRRLSRGFSEDLALKEDQLLGSPKDAIGAKALFDSVSEHCG